jgi:hypothetical protein
LRVKIGYHDFKSDVKDIDYGAEWDLSVSKKFGSLTCLIKYATFKNDGLLEKIGTQTLASDADKFWLQADWSF